MQLKSSTIPAALSRAAAISGRGVIFLDSSSSARKVTYAELLVRSGWVAASMAAAGVGPRDHVLVGLPNGQEFLETFYGSILAGAIPCPFAPGGESGAKGRLWFEQVRRTVKLLDAKAVVVERRHRDALAEAGSGVLVMSPDQTLRDKGSPAPDSASAEETAFVQLTSGTTSVPKAVQLSHRAVLTNAAQIAVRSETRSDSVGVTWLPLFHDMGLVGSVLTSLYAGIDLVLLRPIAFLRRPEFWLQTIDRFRATHSPAPTFAFSYVLHRLVGQRLADLDLSSWQVAFVGAEPVRAEILSAFEERLSNTGLSETVLLPCYGMAEASLAVTTKPAGTRYRSLDVSRQALARDQRAVAAEEEDDALTLVSCGTPVDGTEVVIQDRRGARLAPGQVGEITIRGPSLFSGYYGEPESSRDNGFFSTGDLGFVKDDELYVVGRVKETMILSGENHHPAEIEWIVGQIEGVKRCAALGLYDASMGTEQLCLLIEVARGTDTKGTLTTEIRREVRSVTGLVAAQVHLVPPGSIPMTTSGKIRRNEARAALDSGSLG